MTAAGVVPGGGEIHPEPAETNQSALEAVRSGAADFACVPIENSIEGSVLPTLDSLAVGSPLQIYAELTLDVSFSIVTRPGVSLEQVRSVAAFPVAAAQVRQWLAAHLPGAELVVIRGAAHGFMLEHGATFNRTVLDFLDRTRVETLQTAT